MELKFYGPLEQRYISQYLKKAAILKSKMTAINGVGKIGNIVFVVLDVWAVIPETCKDCTQSCIWAPFLLHKPTD